MKNKNIIVKFLRFFINPNYHIKRMLADFSLNNKSKDERAWLKAITVAKVHDKTFSEYKNKFAGKEIAIIATGPSLQKYKPIENAITIGLNKAALKEELNLDIVFMQDWVAVKDYINVFDYKYRDIPKFFGCAPEEYFDNKNEKITNAIIPESIALKYNAKRYFQYCTISQNNIHFNKDIDCNYLECGGSVAIAAAQFALYTNPKRIYIVGCDCTSGHFDGSKGVGLTHLTKSWAKLKEFADIYYPETEIVSVNPVGLKGLFNRDIFTE